MKLIFQTPADLSISKTNVRMIQKKWLSDVLKIPDEIVYRKKQGFGGPMTTWLDGSLFDFSKKVIFNSNLIKNNILSWREINNNLFNQQRSKGINSLIYYFTVLSIWFDSLPKQIGQDRCYS